MHLLARDGSDGAAASAYRLRLSDIPFVLFMTEDQPSLFLVDTGTPVSSVKRKTVESWGLIAAIQLCDDAFCEDITYICDSELCCLEPGDYPHASPSLISFVFTSWTAAKTSSPWIS